MFWFVVGVVTLTLFAGIWLVGGALRRYLFQRRIELSRRQFTAQRQALEASFLEAAAASGKPRGLLWRQCDFHGEPFFALDRATRHIYCLVAVTIGFEAVPGGDMEDVEAVSNLRCATAVFVRRDGQWTTDGRVVFNLEPPEALQRYRDSLDPLD